MIYHYLGKPIFADATGFTTYIDGKSYNADTILEIVEFINNHA